MSENFLSSLQNFFLSSRVFFNLYENFFLILWTIFLTLFGIFLVKKIFPKIWFLDNPKKFWYSRNPVPYPAWIIIPIIFFIIIFAIFPVSKQILGFFFASVILVATSFFDDRYWLSPIFRLWIQALSAWIIIASGIWISEVLSPIWWVLNLNIWWIEIFGHYFYPIADFLVFFWIIWMINSMNWADWVSWNTSWLAALSWWFLFFLAISPFVWQPDIAKMFLVFAVITTIFFFFDLEKPSVLIGDSGSMFLWFAIAVFAVFAWWKMATAMIVMWIPIFDAFYTIFRRIKNWQNPMKWDMEHFHHILLDKWFSRKNSVLIYILLSASFWIPTIFLETEWKFILLIILCVFMIFLEIFLRRK